MGRLIYSIVAKKQYLCRETRAAYGPKSFYMDKENSKGHPLERFHHCPMCGSGHFEASSEKSKKCRDCGFEFFLNSAAATVAIIEDGQGRVLVTRRANNPARGTLDLPGGFCDHGESAERGVVREVMEETGLRVTDVRYLFSLPNVYPYSGLDIFTTDLFFLCRVEEGTAKAMDDAAELTWMRWEDLRPADFGLASISQGVRLLLAKRGMQA